ncbi:MAG TPA: hypothetical protein VND93_19165 [Myxococcales bacterium]|nr:hypothetical protein [Myxococcales bacterium]
MRLPLALITCALAGALPAAASEAAPAPVQLTYSKEAFQPWSLDTGWMPEEGPVRVRFIGFVGGGLRSVAPGAVHLAWPQSRVWAEGEVNAGQLSMDLGVELQTFMHLELQIPGGPLLTWEGPIPLVPGFDYRFADAGAFTPFLLGGEAASVSDTIQQTELYSLSLTDLIIPIPGIEGEIEVSAGGLLDVAMRGARLAFPEGEITRSGESVPVTLPSGTQYQTAVRYDADVTYQGSLLLEPAVVLHLGPLEWDLAQFDLPVPLPAVTETWKFQEQPASFQLPPPEPAGAPDAGSPPPPPGPGDELVPQGFGCTGAGGAFPIAGLALLALGLVLRRAPTRPSP